MRIVSIEEQTFTKLKEKISNLTKKVSSLNISPQEKEWLDNQDVCLKLNISLRTLQSYRERGKIPYSIVEHKCYYKTSDIDKFMEKMKMKKLK